MEGEVDDLAMQILAAGVEPKDLRAISISMKISNDLERIGDEASAIAKSVIRLNEQSNREAPFREDRRSLVNSLMRLLSQGVIFLPRYGLGLW